MGEPWRVKMGYVKSSRVGSGRCFNVINQAGEIKRPSKKERDRVIADGKCAGVGISCLVEFVLFGVGLWLKNRGDGKVGDVGNLRSEERREKSRFYV